MMDDGDLVRVAHALSDPTRLGIFRMLLQGREGACCSPQDACCPEGVCVCDLEQRLGMIQSKISYHLRELKESGLISETRSGKWNYYSVVDDRIIAFAGAMSRLVRVATPVTPITAPPRRNSTGPIGLQPQPGRG